jgi:hypothetical protein
VDDVERRKISPLNADISAVQSVAIPIALTRLSKKTVAYII